VPAAGGQGLEDRVKPFDRLFVATEHHAITALDAPDSATGAHVEVVDPSGLERLGPANVILEVRVAAVDDRIARFHEPAKLFHGRFGGYAGRDHYPGGPRFG